MIFPLFLFVAGVSMPYSIGNKIAKAGLQTVGQLPAKTKKEIYLSMARRRLDTGFAGFGGKWGT